MKDEGMKGKTSCLHFIPHPCSFALPKDAVNKMKVYPFVLVVVLACASSLPVSALAVNALAGRGERVSPAGEVVVVLSEEFLNSLLQAVASQPEPPSFPLSKDDDQNKKCASRIQLLRESAGTRTSVRF